jgi:hypothetical protein
LRYSEGYAQTDIDSTKKLHQLLLVCPDNMVVNHINLKKFDNRILISELLRYLKIIEIDLYQAQIHRVLWVFRKLSKTGLVVGFHLLTTIKVRNAENHLHDCHNVKIWRSRS